MHVLCDYRLEEAEERYNNRESRQEDLELIEQLRNAIQEREHRMKTLIVSFVDLMTYCGYDPHV